ncbi:MAG: hypothetical protein ACYDD2_11185 [Candidatus Acidiferrales bacterium]
MNIDRLRQGHYARRILTLCYANYIMNEDPYSTGGGADADEEADQANRKVLVEPVRTLAYPPISRSEKRDLKQRSADFPFGQITKRMFHLRG